MAGALIVYVLFRGYAISAGLGTVFSFSSLSSSSSQLKLLSWNVAAINNNPFEYWITLKSNPSYRAMMDGVQHFIDAPGMGDVRVDEVFTPRMFAELEVKMLDAGFDAQHVERTKAIWASDFSARRIVSGFLKDSELGLKRLVSMPDRYTNTIDLASSSSPRAYRPSVINCYGGDDLGSVASWWTQWKRFMFDAKITTKNRKTKQTNTHTVSSSLVPISRAKYPAITESEAEISIPLQTMTLAIFDSILVHIANELSSRSSSDAGIIRWQRLRAQVCKALNHHKTARTLEILGTRRYRSSDVMFLQECASSFVGALRADPVIGKSFTVIVPSKQNKRNQNSLILLNKKRFAPKDVARHVEQSRDILDAMLKANGGKKIKAAAGDVLATIVNDMNGVPYFLASFHGDTNGLATIPVTDAVVSVHESIVKQDADAGREAPILVFGLDANTYEFAKPGKTQDVMAYATSYDKHGLTSCWGGPESGGVDPTEHTTYNARTYLQPQLNKAARRSEIKQKGDVNPKDFILFNPSQWSSTRCGKDNTGSGRFIEDMVFPTLEFPSDHGILSTVLTQQQQQQ
jgi:hypothetical protein